MALTRIPFIFVQDDLLDTGGFLRAAKERGFDVDLDLLYELYVRGLLIPMYRVSNTAVKGRKVEIPYTVFGMNPRGWVLQAAAEGRLRDPLQEGCSVMWPFRRPEGSDRRTWWDGFVYSSWQLVDLHDALRRYSVACAGWYVRQHNVEVRRRRALLALCALSPRFLPSVLGRVRGSLDRDDVALWQFRREAPTRELLSVAGFAPADLQPYADSLLGFAAGRDPLAKLMPLLRHFSFQGWSKLRGEPLDCMWHRVAAEVLLLAHDDLATAGDLEPLPDLTGSTFQLALHDRLTPQFEEAETLERALGDFGLSPHPRVIVLVEGDTEFLHVPRLLAQLGLTQPQQVRVQRCEGSRVNPQLIARYGVTPRIGRPLPDGWLLDATTTAMVIAMDAENKWATAEKRDKVRRTLLAAIREEVEAQGASIRDDFLEFLVTVHTWGADKYELANFTDQELVEAIERLTSSNPNPPQPGWREKLHAELELARLDHLDIKVPLGQAGLSVSKVRLAEELWPVLQRKLETELAENNVSTPVIRLIMDVREKFVTACGIRAMHGDMP